MGYVDVIHASRGLRQPVELSLIRPLATKSDDQQRHCSHL